MLSILSSYFQNGLSDRLKVSLYEYVGMVLQHSRVKERKLARITINTLDYDIDNQGISTWSLLNLVEKAAKSTVLLYIKSGRLVNSVKIRAKI